jgi:hypothetical protein
MKPGRLARDGIVYASSAFWPVARALFHMGIYSLEFYENN